MANILEQQSPLPSPIREPAQLRRRGEQAGQYHQALQSGLRQSVCEMMIIEKKRKGLTTYGLKI